MENKLRTIFLLASSILPVTAEPGPKTAPSPAPVEIQSAAEPVVAATPNEQALVRYYAAVTEGKLDAVAAFLTDDFRCDAALPGLKPGPEGYRNFLAIFRTAFPDARFEPVLFLSQGEYTVCRYRFTGTHRAKFLNLRPTHKAASVAGIDIWKFRDGKMVELQGTFDALGLLVQLGLVPPIKEPDAGTAKTVRPGNTPR